MYWSFSSSLGPDHHAGVYRGVLQMSDAEHGFLFFFSFQLWWWILGRTSSCMPPLYHIKDAGVPSVIYLLVPGTQRQR